jgi:hypothetical protein
MPEGTDLRDRLLGLLERSSDIDQDAVRAYAVQPTRDLSRGTVRGRDLRNIYAVRFGRLGIDAGRVLDRLAQLDLARVFVVRRDNRVWATFTDEAMDELVGCLPAVVTSGHATWLLPPPEITDPGQPRLVPCACCGCLTVVEEFDICPVCFWQADAVGQNDPSRPSGPNQVSLNEARSNYERIGACEPRLIRFVRPPEPWERSASQRKADGEGG